MGTNVGPTDFLLHTILCGKSFASRASLGSIRSWRRKNSFSAMDYGYLPVCIFAGDPSILESTEVLFPKYF